MEKQRYFTLGNIIVVTCVILTMLAILFLSPELSTPVRDILINIITLILWISVFERFIKKESMEPYSDRIQTILLFAACNFLGIAGSLINIVYAVLTFQSLEQHLTGRPSMILYGTAAMINGILILLVLVRKAKLRRAYKTAPSPAESL